MATKNYFTWRGRGTSATEERRNRSCGFFRSSFFKGPTARLPHSADPTIPTSVLAALSPPRRLHQVRLLSPLHHLHVVNTLGPQRLAKTLLQGHGLLAGV